MLKFVRRAAILAVLVAVCAVVALTTGLVSRGGASASASGPCQLGTKAGQVKHVIYLQFDNTHYRRDNANVASDLEQMPHLLNFLKGNGTLLTNHHTILISHTAGGILSSLTGLYPDRHGQAVSNSYDWFQANGLPTFTSSFKYWTDTASGTANPLPNMVGDGGQTAPAPWQTYTQAGCNVGAVSTANIVLENNNAIVQSSLAAASAVGGTNIKVASVAPFFVGQAITVDIGAAAETATISAVGTAGAAGTGLTLTAPLANAHASGAKVFATDPGGDMTRVFGAGSPQWNEARDSQLAAAGTAARVLAQTDFVGFAIHCAQGDALCNNPNARPDDTTIYPGSDNGFKALFGAKNVNPAITGGNPCVKATDGSNITDQFSQCGFPGFDGALAKNTLGEVAQMQENGVPVTFAYISDAHDNHTLVRASGPGEADYQAQLKAYDDAFVAFFDRLKAHGIDKSNSLFVVTADEGDHFAGGKGLPDPANPGALTYVHAPCSTLTACPSNQIGEVNGNIKALAPGSYDIHFDDAPTFYVNGQPNRNDTTVRDLERTIGNATAQDPYVNNGALVPIAERLADTVEEKTLHMVTSDPKRTPTFTMFGNADFFWQTSTPSCGATICVNPNFAWNHGDFQDDIANTWLGVVGPGVQSNGIDTKTWSDHVDIRPTINALIGLKDSYLDDGRAITEILGGKAEDHGHNEHGSKSDDHGKRKDEHGQRADALGAIYKQVNAPFGAFALDTLIASTAALKSTDELKYDSIETQIANLTLQRDVLAGAIRAALNDAATGNDDHGDKGGIDSSQAKAWIKQAQSLLDQAHALAVANPA